jgi:hypothetical protein
MAKLPITSVKLWIASARIAALPERTARLLFRKRKTIFSSV